MNEIDEYNLAVQMYKLNRYKDCIFHLKNLSSFTGINNQNLEVAFDLLVKLKVYSYQDQEYLNLMLIYSELFEKKRQHLKSIFLLNQIQNLSTSMCGVCHSKMSILYLQEGDIENTLKTAAICLQYYRQKKCFWKALDFIEVIEKKLGKGYFYPQKIYFLKLKNDRKELDIEFKHLYSEFIKNDKFFNYSSEEVELILTHGQATKIINAKFKLLLIHSGRDVKLSYFEFIKAVLDLMIFEFDNIENHILALCLFRKFENKTLAQKLLNIIYSLEKRDKELNKFLRKIKSDIESLPAGPSLKASPDSDLARDLFAKNAYILKETSKLGEHKSSVNLLSENINLCHPKEDVLIYPIQLWLDSVAKNQIGDLVVGLIFMELFTDCEKLIDLADQKIVDNSEYEIQIKLNLQYLKIEMLILSMRFLEALKNIENCILSFPLTENKKACFSFLRAKVLYKMGHKAEAQKAYLYAIETDSIYRGIRFEFKGI